MGSKSGILANSLGVTYLETILKPYDAGEPVFLIKLMQRIKNTALYDTLYRDENDLPTCTLKIIPPKCTPLCQSCDLFFYRPVKQLISHMQNYVF